MVLRAHCHPQVFESCLIRGVLVRSDSNSRGKDRLAEALHALSERAAQPRVAINCAAIPETLLESELFGYERGAFTGAVKQALGKIETANGGMLFLDEIGDMPLALQAKLLRFLQERVIERLGGRELIQVDVCIIAATHRDLKTEIEQGRFREDLYYRSGEVSVVIPPLRERGSDGVLLAHYVPAGVLQAPRQAAAEARPRRHCRDRALPLARQRARPREPGQRRGHHV